MRAFVFAAMCIVLPLSGYGQNDSGKIISPVLREHDSVLQETNGVVTPVNTINDHSINNQSQNINPLLASSRDIFLQASVLHFSTARFHYRGYATDRSVFLVNGIRYNHSENGAASITNMGGLTDLIRLMDMRAGPGSSRSTFGDIGGYLSLNINASSFQKGTRIAYSRGNRIYTDRVSVSHSTGIMKNGMALAGSITARNADLGYAPGTFYHGLGYLLVIDKKLNDRHTLSVGGFGTLSDQGRQSMETDEAFRLTNNPHYNSYWGFQTDSVTHTTVSRSAKESTNNKSNILFSHIFSKGEKIRWVTSFSYSYSRTGLTNLNWYSANVPQPDYYKFLPSYFSPMAAKPSPYRYAYLTYNWLNDLGGVRQINWNALYNANYNDLYFLSNANGISGNTITGRRSKYILEDQRQDLNTIGASSVLNIRAGNYFITAGINANSSATHHYKVLDDLLGGDFWLDLDQFVTANSPDSMLPQNNIHKPNAPIHKGDIFGYDYWMRVKRTEAWMQAERNFQSLDLYLGGTLSTTSYQREGIMVNGKFPSSSGGLSKEQGFLNAGFKAGVNYKINGRHYIVVNTTAFSKAPPSQNSFVSPQTRNDLVVDVAPNYGNEKVFAGDISWYIKYPRLQGRASCYYSRVNNQTWLRSYYDDAYKTIVNYMMTRLSQLNRGFETGLEGNITKRVILVGAFGAGQFIYANRPLATISADNSANLLASSRVIYLKNYHVGNMPETVASLGIRYNGKKNWMAGLYYNYFADQYVEINPDRRTEEVVSKFISTDPEYKKIVSQEKLPAAYTLDLVAMRSFRITRKYGVNTSLLVNNLTNTVFKNSGAEQLRHDISNIDKFPNKYSYAMGLSFMISVSLVIH